MIITVKGIVSSIYNFLTQYILIVFDKSETPSAPSV